MSFSKAGETVPQTGAAGPSSGEAAEKKAPGLTTESQGAAAASAAKQPLIMGQATTSAPTEAGAAFVKPTIVTAPPSGGTKGKAVLIESPLISPRTVGGTDTHKTYESGGSATESLALSSVGVKESPPLAAGEQFDAKTPASKPAAPSTITPLTTPLGTAAAATPVRVVRPAGVDGRTAGSQSIPIGVLARREPRPNYAAMHLATPEITSALNINASNSRGTLFPTRGVSPAPSNTSASTIAQLSGRPTNGAVSKVHSSSPSSFGPGSLEMGSGAPGTSAITGTGGYHGTSSQQPQQQPYTSTPVQSRSSYPYMGMPGAVTSTPGSMATGGIPGLPTSTTPTTSIPLPPPVVPQHGYSLRGTSPFRSTALYTQQQQYPQQLPQSKVLTPSMGYVGGEAGDRYATMALPAEEVAPAKGYYATFDWKRHIDNVPQHILDTFPQQTKLLPSIPTMFHQMLVILQYVKTVTGGGDILHTLDKKIAKLSGRSAQGMFDPIPGLKPGTVPLVDVDGNWTDPRHPVCRDRRLSIYDPEGNEYVVSACRREHLSAIFSSPEGSILGKMGFCPRLMEVYYVTPQGQSVVAGASVNPSIPCTCRSGMLEESSKAPAQAKAAESTKSELGGPSPSPREEAKVRPSPREAALDTSRYSESSELSEPNGVALTYGGGLDGSDNEDDIREGMADLATRKLVDGTTLETPEEIQRLLKKHLETREHEKGKSATRDEELDENTVDGTAYAGDGISHLPRGESVWSGIRRLSASGATPGTAGGMNIEPALSFLWADMAKKLEAAQRAIDNTWRRKILEKQRHLDESLTQLQLAQEQAQAWERLWREEKTHNVMLLNRLRRIEQDLGRIEENARRTEHPPSNGGAQPGLAAGVGPGGSEHFTAAGARLIEGLVADEGGDLEVSEARLAGERLTVGNLVNVAPGPSRDSLYSSANRMRHEGPGQEPVAVRDHQSVYSKAGRPEEDTLGRVRQLSNQSKRGGKRKKVKLSDEAEGLVDIEEEEEDEEEDEDDEETEAEDSKDRDSRDDDDEPPAPDGGTSGGTSNGGPGFAGHYGSTGAQVHRSQGDQNNQSTTFGQPSGSSEQRYHNAIVNRRQPSARTRRSQQSDDEEDVDPNDPNALELVQLEPQSSSETRTTPSASIPEDAEILPGGKLRSGISIPLQKVSHALEFKDYPLSIDNDISEGEDSDDELQDGDTNGKNGSSFRSDLSDLNMLDIEYMGAAHSEGTSGSAPTRGRRRRRHGSRRRFCTVKRRTAARVAAIRAREQAEAEASARADADYVASLSQADLYLADAQSLLNQRNLAQMLLSDADNRFTNSTEHLTPGPDGVRPLARPDYDRDFSAAMAVLNAAADADLDIPISAILTLPHLLRSIFAPDEMQGIESKDQVKGGSAQPGEGGATSMLTAGEQSTLASWVTGLLKKGGFPAHLRRGSATTRGKGFSLSTLLGLNSDSLVEPEPDKRELGRAFGIIGPADERLARTSSSRTEAKMVAEEFYVPTYTHTTRQRAEHDINEYTTVDRSAFGGTKRASAPGASVRRRDSGPGAIGGSGNYDDYVDDDRSYITVATWPFTRMNPDGQVERQDLVVEYDPTRDLIIVEEKRHIVEQPEESDQLDTQPVAAKRPSLKLLQEELSKLKTQNHQLEMRRAVLLRELSRAMYALRSFARSFARRASHIDAYGVESSKAVKLHAFALYQSRQALDNVREMLRKSSESPLLRKLADQAESVQGSRQPITVVGRRFTITKAGLALSVAAAALMARAYLSTPYAPPASALLTNSTEHLSSVGTSWSKENEIHWKIAHEIADVLQAKSGPETIPLSLRIALASNPPPVGKPESPTRTLTLEEQETFKKTFEAVRSRVRLQVSTDKGSEHQASIAALVKILPRQQRRQARLPKGPSEASLRSLAFNLSEVAKRLHPRSSISQNLEDATTVSATPPRRLSSSPATATTTGTATAMRTAKQSKTNGRVPFTPQGAPLSEKPEMWSLQTSRESLMETPMWTQRGQFGSSSASTHAPMVAGSPNLPITMPIGSQPIHPVGSSVDVEKMKENAGSSTQAQRGYITAPMFAHPKMLSSSPSTAQATEMSSGAKTKRDEPMGTEMQSLFRAMDEDTMYAVNVNGNGKGNGGNAERSSGRKSTTRVKPKLKETTSPTAAEPVVSAETPKVKRGPGRPRKTPASDAPKPIKPARRGSSTPVEETPLVARQAAGQPSSPLMLPHSLQQAVPPLAVGTSGAHQMAMYGVQSAPLADSNTGLLHQPAAQSQIQPQFQLEHQQQQQQQEAQNAVAGQPSIGLMAVPLQDEEKRAIYMHHFKQHFRQHFQEELQRLLKRHGATMTQEEIRKHLDAQMEALEQRSDLQQMFQLHYFLAQNPNASAAQVAQMQQMLQSQSTGIVAAPPFVWQPSGVVAPTVVVQPLQDGLTLPQADSSQAQRQMAHSQVPMQQQQLQQQGTQHPPDSTAPGPQGAK